MKFSMRRLLIVMRDVRILGMDVWKSVRMIVAAILYEIGLMQKIKNVIVVEAMALVLSGDLDKLEAEIEREEQDV